MRYWKGRIAAALVLTSHATAGVLWSPQTSQGPAKLTRAEFLPGAGYSIAIEAPPGSYDLEFSDTLGAQSWQNLITLDPEGGEDSYLDATALTRDRGFYRVGGSYTSSHYHSISSRFAVEAGFASSVNGGPRGDLISGVSTADLLLEHQGVVAGLARYRNPVLIEGYIAPEIADLTAFRGTEQAVTNPLSFTVDGWQIEIPAGPYSLPYGQALATGTTFSYEDMESDLASLVALGLRSYQGAVNPESEDPEPFNGRRLELPFLIQKSTDAAAEDLTGEWGMIQLGVRGQLTDPGDNMPPTLPGHVCYTILAAVAELTASSATEAALSISRESRFEVEQSFDPEEAISRATFESTEARSFEINVEPNGAVLLRDVQDEARPLLFGAASPTTSLLAAAGNIPSADAQAEDPGQENGFIDPGASTETQVAIAVRRDVNPILANRSYRAIRLGLYITRGGFEISRWLPGAEAVINSDATEVNIAADQDFYAVTFDGSELFESFTAGGPYQLQVAQDGMITLSENIPDFQDARYVGFAQLGGNLIILGGTTTQTNIAAEVSMMILIADP